MKRTKTNFGGIFAAALIALSAAIIAFSAQGTSAAFADYSATDNSADPETTILTFQCNTYPFTVVTRYEDYQSNYTNDTTHTITSASTRVELCSDWDSAYENYTYLVDIYNSNGDRPETCSIDYTNYYASSISSVIVQLSFAPHMHSYTASVVAGTCKEQGYTLHACACGDSYKDNYTALGAHHYENNICTVCGENNQYQLGYELGYELGLAAGREQGEADGYQLGYQDGLVDESKEAYQTGYEAGFENGAEEGRQNGYETGYAEGLENGLAQGIEDGRLQGETEGIKLGYKNGYNAGYATAYDEGRQAGYDKGYADGFEQGKKEGLEQGKQEGYTDGFNEGYQQGAQAGAGDVWQAGKKQGEEEGYQKGYEAGLQQTGNAGIIANTNKGLIISTVVLALVIVLLIAGYIVIRKIKRKYEVKRR